MTFTAWSGTLAFGPWWLLYGGPISPTELHAHHAFQIVVHGGTPCIVDAVGEAIHGPIAVIEPGQPHAIQSRRDHALVVFVEPQSRAGLALRDRQPVEELGRSHPVAEVIGDLTPDNWSRVDEAVRRMLALAGLSEPPAAPRWWRHPAVDEAFLRVPDPVTDAHGDVDVSDLAATVGVSISRLTQVFSSEVGIPLRAYARWLRLLRAIELLADGATFTEAAHAVGFAKTAHFTRSFEAMFGLQPSEVLLIGSWVR